MGNGVGGAGNGMTGNVESSTLMSGIACLNQRWPAPLELQGIMALFPGYVAAQVISHAAYGGSCATGWYRRDDFSH